MVQRGRSGLSSPGGCGAERGPCPGPGTQPPAADPGLAVAVGLALQRLESLRTEGGIKWPNGLLPRGRKLDGLLPALAAEDPGASAGPRWDWGSMAATGYRGERSTWPKRWDVGMPDQRGGRPSPPASSRPWTGRRAIAGDPDGV